jgi:phosphatidate phosphatase APP1
LRVLSLAMVAKRTAAGPPAEARAEFGVISDIDDSVVRTGVLNRRRMTLTLARTNAHARLPFPAVGALYRALVGGASGTDGNPVFYVSRGPRNLYAPRLRAGGARVSGPDCGRLHPRRAAGPAARYGALPPGR